MVIVTFLGMIIINALANLLPINNTTTGDISDAYPNLFAPIGLTFSIWGVIYTLLAAYTLYQSGWLKTKIPASTKNLIQSINPFFILSSIANMIWIFTWHYRLIGMSLIFMGIILFSLIKIANLTYQKKLTSKDNFLIRVPFSVYFGWITVATIANVTTFLVSLNWNGLGLAPVTWTVIILLVGAAIGLLRLFKDKSPSYGLVLIWAYFGIYLKHTSTAYFNNQYPQIIITVLICLGIFLLAQLKLYKRA